MDMQIVTNAELVLSLLHQFDCSFIHMHDKVPDYNAYAQKLAKHALVYRACEQQETCGLVVMYANNTEESLAFIALFGFLPEWQGKHLGKEMMDFCSVEARARGMQRIRLEVDLDNHRAIAFYTRNGFSAQGLCSPKSMYMEKALV